jgi:hypothetical protein
MAEIVLIDDLNPVPASRAHILPATTGGSADRISVEEILGLLASSDLLPVLHGSGLKTALIAADRLILWDSVSSQFREVTLANFWAQLKWKAVKVGEAYLVNTALAGVDIPPISDPEVSFIELTAGLTGSGAFNNGKLSTESVSGSAPLVTASAVVSLAASPMVGQTVQLINTEGRSLRPNTSPGVLQNDAIQGHHHDMWDGTSSTTAPLAVNGSIASTGGVVGVVSGTSRIWAGTAKSDGTNGTTRIANETRGKNLGVKAYMRIK